jgi:hypothetical protein
MGPKLLNFKIKELNLQNNKNRETKTALNPKINNTSILTLIKMVTWVVDNSATLSKRASSPF